MRAEKRGQEQKIRRRRKRKSDEMESGDREEARLDEKNVSREKDLFELSLQTVMVPTRVPKRCDG